MSKRDSRERFKSLANVRVNKAIKILKLIGNLSNKQHYSFDDTDAKKIILALESELKNVKLKFSYSKEKDGGFKIE